MHAQPRPLDTRGHAHSVWALAGSCPRASDKSLEFLSHVAHVRPCAFGIWTRGTGRLPPSTPPAVTAQVVQEERPVLLVVSFRPWTQKAR